MIVFCLTSRAPTRAPWVTRVSVDVQPFPGVAGAQNPTRFDDPVPDGCNVDGCSLREALAESANDATITLEAGTYEITRAELPLNGFRPRGRGRAKDGDQRPEHEPRDLGDHGLADDRRRER
jgi:hypothetical protein